MGGNGRATLPSLSLSGEPRKCEDDETESDIRQSLVSNDALTPKPFLSDGETEAQGGPSSLWHCLGPLK